MKKSRKRKNFSIKEIIKFKQGKLIVICSSEAEREALLKRFPKGTIITVKAETGDAGTYRIMDMESLKTVAKAKAAAIEPICKPYSEDIEKQREFIKFLQEEESLETLYNLSND